MESEVSLKSDEHDLVKPSRRDALVQKLNAFKEEGLNAKEKQYADEVKKEFAATFVNLAYNLMGISKDQLKKLNDKNDLEELAEILNEKTKKRTRIYVPLCALIPIAGWIIFLVQIQETDQKCWCLYYRHSYKFLKKIFGKNWFPYECVKGRIE